jgi:hypothetical protein
MLVCAANTDGPQRFIIYSALHCGTHFVREALAAPPDVTVGDEVFARGLPSSLGLKASRDEIHGQFFVDPEHYVKDTVIPIHRFYLGLTDLSSTRGKIRSPPAS